MSSPSKPVTWLLISVGVTLAVGAALVAGTRAYWLPLLAPSETATNDSIPSDPHAGHDHAGSSASNSIELTGRGLKNIGFEPFTVAPSDYQRKLTLPAIVIERPGRSQIHITAPFTGIVTNIHAVTGEAVGPGEPLFEMRLTHEDLVAAQRELLDNLSKLGIVEQEIDRLESLGEGVVAGKRILEQQYEKRRLEAALQSAEQAMLMHGLTEEQVADVRRSGQLFRNTTVRAPEHTETDEACHGPHLFTVQSLGVAKGEHVEVGRELATLADHCELHIEALAFEDDAPAIRRAAEADREVTARLQDRESPGRELRGLKILYVAGQIDADSRAFKVYVPLPNEIALDRETPGGKRFLEWIYKPGQRMRLRVPVETWEGQLVLPTTAVVDEGAEAYVYRQNGDQFDQVPVHVRHRDQNAVVVANDGALFPGDVIAGRGAYQMHLALKNQSGGAIDPHAGHNH